MLQLPRRNNIESRQKYGTMTKNITLNKGKMVSPQYETPGYSTKFYTVGSAPSCTLYTYSYIPFLNEKV